MPKLPAGGTQLRSRRKLVASATAMTRIVAPARAGTRALALARNERGFKLGGIIVLNPGKANEECATVVGLEPAMALSVDLLFDHAPGEPLYQVCPCRAHTARRRSQPAPDSHCPRTPHTYVTLTRVLASAIIRAAAARCGARARTSCAA